METTDKGSFGIIDDVKRYVDIKIKLARLSFRENASKSLGSVIPVIAIIIFTSLFLLFGSLTVAFLLSEKLDSLLWGFLIVGAFYGVLSLLIYLFRKSLGKYFTDFFVKVMFKNFED